jgi:hypothetical protein
VPADPRSVQLDRTHEAQPEGARGRGRPGHSHGDSVSLSSLGSQVARALGEPSTEEIVRLEQAQRAERVGGLDVSDEELADALIAGALRDTTLDAEIARLSQPVR